MKVLIFGVGGNELGWEPEHSIFDTLKEMYQEYLRH